MHSACHLLTKRLSARQESDHSPDEGMQDDDGTAYVAYSSENNMVMHIACLKPDYLAPEPDYHRVRQVKHLHLSELRACYGMCM